MGGWREAEEGAGRPSQMTTLQCLVCPISRCYASGTTVVGKPLSSAACRRLSSLARTSRQNGNCVRVGAD